MNTEMPTNTITPLAPDYLKALQARAAEGVAPFLTGALHSLLDYPSSGYLGLEPPRWLQAAQTLTEFAMGLLETEAGLISDNIASGRRDWSRIVATLRGGDTKMSLFYLAVDL